VPECLVLSHPAMEGGRITAPLTQAYLEQLGCIRYPHHLKIYILSARSVLPREKMSKFHEF